MRRHPCTIGLLAGVLLAAACGADTPEARIATGNGDGDGGPQYEGTFTVLESPYHGPQLCWTVATSYPPQCGGPDIEGWDWDAVDGEETALGVTWGSYHVTGTFADGRFALTAPAGPPDLGDVPDREAPDFSPACDEPEVIDPAQPIPLTGNPEELPDLVASWVSHHGNGWAGPSAVLNLVVLPGSGAATRDHVRQDYGGPLCVVERDGPTLIELHAIQAELMDADATEHLGQVQGTAPDGIIGKVRTTVWVADAPALDYSQQRWGDLVQLEGLLQPTS